MEITTNNKTEPSNIDQDGMSNALDNHQNSSNNRSDQDPRDANADKNRKKKSSSSNILDVTNLSVHYGENCALQGINLSVEKGLVYAFIGAFRMWKKHILKMF